MPRSRPVGRSAIDRRTKICLWVIIVGLGNFLAYTMMYALIGGEAVNGTILQMPDGETVYRLQSGREVSAVTFVYSGIHSISIWPTAMAVLLAMLTLAKDRIIDSMQKGVLRGRSVCTLLAVLIAISMAGLTFLFIRQFVSHFDHPVRITETTRAPHRP
ncbi:MAG: hypothetical protein ACLFV7_02180 [Phycisphaerae bacterium]